MKKLPKVHSLVVFKLDELQANQAKTVRCAKLAVVQAADKRTIEVKTRGFEFAHGRKPKGRGSWAFKFDRGDIHWYHGELYSAAKSQAVKDALSCPGVHSIEVLS